MTVSPVVRGGAAASRGRVATIIAVLVVLGLSVPPLVVLVVQGVAGMGAETVPPARLLVLLGNTLLLAALVVALSLPVGTATAWLTVRTTFAGRRVWATVITIPLVLPAYVVAVALSGMFGGDGLLTDLLRPWGISRLPPAAGLWAATLCLTIVAVPIVHTLVTVALSRMDPALEETARLLGQSGPRLFFRVILPQLRGTLALAACVVALYVISDFGAVSMLRYETFTRAIYAQFRGRVEVGPAFALCLTLVLVSGVLIAGQVMLRGRHGAGAAHTRPAAVTPLRPLATAIASTLLGVLVLFSTVLPVMTLTTWALRGWAAGARPGPVLEEAVNAFGLALLAGAVTTLLAFPIALAARRRSRFTRAMEGVPWITHSLPHLAVGLAILVLSIAGPAALYQSRTTLVLAYAALFLPLAIGPLSEALRGIDERLLDVSRSLGRSEMRTLVGVVLPLVRPAMLTGAALVFFATLHELPVTLLLRPTGSETLAVRLWGAMIEGQYTTASIAALLMVVISVPLLALHARSQVRASVAS